MKKITTIFLFTFLSLLAEAQTNVGGGIYSNTAWTKAQSPYTVDSNVVVFPGVTLTIEPGVVVMAKHTLEIRGSLIAEGTITDSIIFMGPVTIPTPYMIFFSYANSSKLNYCIVKDHRGDFKVGLEGRLNSASDSLTIKNSYFTNLGIAVFGGIGNTIIDSCVFIGDSVAIAQADMPITNSLFRKNQYALLGVGSTVIQNCTIDSNIYIGIESGQQNTITNCQIKNNGTGIKCDVNFDGYGSQIHHNIIEDNSIGIQLYDYGTTDSIFCNRICNNSSYNLKVSTPSNRRVANNYWCSNDSLTIANSIYDGYDNSSFGLIKFMPIDTMQCYLLNGISMYEAQAFSFNIYPSPATVDLTVELQANSANAAIKIYNQLGELKINSTLSNEKSNIDVSNLASGVYILEVATEKNLSIQKFIKQ